VNKTLVFYPKRKWGFVFQGTAIILLIGISLWGIWRAVHAVIGPEFLLNLIPVLVATFFVPLLAYRIYALYGAYYLLERDGVRLHWGLRDVTIPMDVIEWIHPADDLDPRVPLPLFRWPGAVLGMRNLPGKGRVEFIASSTREMLIIASPDHVYAISPAKPDEFRAAYIKLLELGSITPLSAHSVQPTFLLINVWSSRIGRWLILIGFILNLLLLLYVLIAVSNHEQIHLGFYPTGVPADLVPSVRLMLLPVLSIFFFFMDLLLGLFYFRVDEGHNIAYLLWALGVLTPCLFFTGAYFILASG